MNRILVSKIVLWIALALPSLYLASIVAEGGGTGTRAQTILELSGVWSMWLLIAVLAIRPARELFRAAVLIRFRRMVGLFAAYYATVHTIAYVVANDYDWLFILVEIAEHPFLSTGTLALILLVPLVATSTDGMVRRLGGRRWRNLQRIVYGVLIVAVLHYILSVRLSPSEPIMQAGLLGWLLHYRFIVYLRRRRGRPPAMGPATLAWTGAAWTVMTGALELLFFKVNTTISLSAVLGSYLHPVSGLRPATVVGIVAMALVAAKWGHGRIQFRRTAQPS
ncbi:MAG: ferric reductase-like transmembrane domain-containing protein [Alphaproteobacteria bacterium]|nr:ferric reductase-like transmembrane domain-containing protein [Alphaproteobacteria bacterium]